MSLDECCHKFTNRKISVKDPAQKAAIKWRGEEKILEVSVNPVEKIEEGVLERKIIDEIKTTALESEILENVPNIEKVLKAEKDNMTDERSPIVQHNEDETREGNQKKQTTMMPADMMTKVYFHNLADIKIEMDVASNNQNEGGESQPV